MKKILAILLLVGLIGISFVGCAPDEPEVAPPDDETDEVDEESGEELEGEILIGTVFPLSGPMALLGEESFRGVELARQKWNEEGGINGREIVFVSADAPDTAAATAETERLISAEGMTVIMGSYASPICMAASEVSERHQVIYWETGGIANPIMERGFEYLFRTVQQASDLGIGGIDTVATYGPDALGKDLEDIKVAVVYEDGPYGSTVGEYAVGRAEELGMQVVHDESYSSEAVDLSTLIERLRAAEPDALSITSYITDAILFHEQAAELGFWVPMFIGNGGGHAMHDLADSVGDTIHGVVNVDVAQFEINEDNAPGKTEMYDRYVEEYGHPPRSGHSLLTYSGALGLFMTLEEAGGSLDPDDVREAAISMDIPMFSFPNGNGMKFGDNGQNVYVQGVGHQWVPTPEGDEHDYYQVAISPPELAVAEPEFPMPAWE